MFNDERERTLLEQRTRSESLQAWVQRVQDEAQRERPALPRRVLLWVGRRLITVGSKLTGRFGSPAEQRTMSPRDRVFTH